MLGNNIKKFRLLLNISVEEMAKKIGISYQTLEKYENGELIPNSTILIEIARVLNVKITDLLE